MGICGSVGCGKSSLLSAVLGRVSYFRNLVFSNLKIMLSVTMATEINILYGSKMFC